MTDTHTLYFRFVTIARLCRLRCHGHGPLEAANGVLCTTRTATIYSAAFVTT